MEYYAIFMPYTFLIEYIDFPCFRSLKLKGRLYYESNYDNKLNTIGLFSLHSCVEFSYSTSITYATRWKECKGDD